MIRHLKKTGIAYIVLFILFMSSCEWGNNRDNPYEGWDSDNSSIRLTAPLHNERVHNLSTLLEWQALGDPLSYRVEV